MNRRLKKVLFAGLFLFFGMNLFALEFKSIIPIDGITWNIETTRGFQNVENVFISRASGSETFRNQVFQFRGILFYSYYEKQLLTKAQLNLGFESRTNYLWTENPDINHENMLNNLLRCIEFDIQKLFPLPISYSFSLAPFFSYSYFKVSIDDQNFGINGNTILYNAASGGIQLTTRINRNIYQNFYVSCSPFVFYGFDFSSVYLLNYGFEFKTNASLVSATLFYNAKHAFHQKGITWFNGFRINMNNSEVGFSIHLHLI